MGSFNYSNASEEKQALDAAFRAINKQYGFDKMVDNWVKQNIPKEYIRYAAYVSPVIETASTGRIQLTWEIK